MPVDVQRTLSLGISLPNSGVRTAPLFSSTNLNEFNLVLWDVSTLPQEISAAFSIQFDGVNNQQTYQSFKNDYLRRADGLKNWVSDGNVLVIFPTKFAQTLAYAENNTTQRDDLNKFAL